MLVGAMSQAEAPNGTSLSAPLLGDESERMVVLQSEVLKLMNKLRGLETKIDRLEGQRPAQPLAPQTAVAYQENGRGLPGPENPDVGGLISMKQSSLEKKPKEVDLEEAASEADVSDDDDEVLSLRDRWKNSHFEADKDMSHLRKRLRRPDQDLFIDVLSIFEKVVPGWSEASIDSQGILDLHGGPAARAVPFLAIVLVVPVYWVLPFWGWRSFFHPALTCLDRLVCLISLVCPGWLAWGPLLYMIFGNPGADIRAHQTTVFTLCFPWWALAWRGYNLANQRLCNACDQAVENMKQQVKANAAGSESRTRFRDILDALSDPVDSKSLYPMFTLSEDEEPNYQQLGLLGRLPVLILVIVQVLYALYPLFITECHPWATAMNLTGALTIGLTAYHFCEDLALKMSDFKDCVDEVSVFLFVASPREMRHSRRRRDEYLKLVSQNIGTRLKLHETRDGQKIALPEANFAKKLERKSTINRLGAVAITNDLPLKMRRVEMDLSTFHGVDVYEHLQGWVYADIVNERFGIDTSASILVVMLIALMGVALSPEMVSTNFLHNGISLTQIVAFIDILAMLGYIGLTCNHCVAMNELIFDRADKVLLTWKNHARKPSKTYARVWVNGELKEFAHESAHAKSDPMEVRARIDTTRESICLQEPQQILGMKVTPALRTKLLSTLSAFMVTIGVSMVKKAMGDQS